MGHRSHMYFLADSVTLNTEENQERNKPRREKITTECPLASSRGRRVS